MTKVVNLKEAFKNRKTAAEVKLTTEVIRKEIDAGKITFSAEEASKGKASLASIRNVAEATLGADAVAKYCDPSHGGEGQLVEALHESVDPVNLSAFTNITGTLILKGAYEAYTSPEYIGDKLVTNEVDREDNVRVPGLALIDDDAMNVAEGEEYGAVKFSEDYIDVPKSQKRGLRIALTREMVFFDKTGKVAEMAASVGERLGTNKEKRILSTVLGIDNPFVRKGVARNTYVASADPRINLLASTPLVDWTTLDTAWQLFNAYTDDRTTGEPINVEPKQLLVTPFNLLLAKRILRATETRQTSASAVNTTIDSDASLPGEFEVITSKWITWLLLNQSSSVSVANGKKHWWIGDFKRGFRYRTLFPFQVRAATLQNDEFERDVVAQWRADERGVSYVWAPWYAAHIYDT